LSNDNPVNGGEVDVLEWYGNGNWPAGTTVHAKLNGGEHATHQIAVDSGWHTWRCLRSAKRCVHLQVASPAVVAEIFDREGETVDLDAIETLQSRERHLLIGCGEVEVG
jgi:hypothetical protein